MSLFCQKSFTTSVSPTSMPTDTPTSPPPTLTHTATATPSPIPTKTATVTPSLTPTSKPTFTPSPTSGCNIKDGKWESKEKAGVMPGPMLTFEVQNCTIVMIDIWAFPALNELDWISELNLSLPIEDNQWIYTRQSEEGQLTLTGIFQSDISCSGTLNYTKGYFIVDYTLTQDVEIPWTAAPIGN